MISDASIAELESLLAPESRVLKGDDALGYGSDWSSCGPGSPRFAVLPGTVDDVCAVAQWAARHGVALVPSGGRTGLSGGAVANAEELVVSLERMRRILSFDLGNRTITVQAGVTTQSVQEAAAANGLFYPVDLASRGSSQIGGNIATNAGGIRVLRYGLTRDWVASLKFVTGKGDLLELNRGLVKSATGYDLRHLVIGSEGSLGIIVEATLKLCAPPPQQQVMLLAVPSMLLVMDVYVCLRRLFSLSAFEFFSNKALDHVVAAGARTPFGNPSDCYVLVEFDRQEDAVEAAFRELLESGYVTDAILATSDAEAAELWHLREGITESLSCHQPYKNDVSVRPDLVPAFVREVDALFGTQYPEFEIIWFGHIGDGNLHISILPPPGSDRDAFVAECERVTHMLGMVLREFGGSISAEHGIGLLKRPYLHYTRSPVEIELMRQMKRVFDPAGIMNPGKLFPP